MVTLIFSFLLCGIPSFHSVTFSSTILSSLANRSSQVEGVADSVFISSTIASSTTGSVGVSATTSSTIGSTIFSSTVVCSVGVSTDFSSIIGLAGIFSVIFSSLVLFMLIASELFISFHNSEKSMFVFQVSVLTSACGVTSVLVSVETSKSSKLRLRSPQT
ncbi:hypothetical protein KKG31_08190 [Patescibacteria group bacterium]|nr:hypothetical protein [Patescibacteria group bacterium]MBU1759041.1 hypothetical protein [Patescibacteria group bacterium]